MTATHTPLVGYLQTKFQVGHAPVTLADRIGRHIFPPRGLTPSPPSHLHFVHLGRNVIIVS